MADQSAAGEQGTGSEGDPEPSARGLVTGLVLAGGRSPKMGEHDKALIEVDGQPLVALVIERIRPQVGALVVNANRHLERYARFGLPVWPDSVPDEPGPLAGVLAGLSRCETPWLAVVPCDAPRLPGDLVSRLGQSVGLKADRQDQPGPLAALARSPEAAQPLFCLVHRRAHDALAQQFGAGERRVAAALRAIGACEVPFDDAAAFKDVDTPLDLIALAGRR